MILAIAIFISSAFAEANSFDTCLSDVKECKQDCGTLQGIKWSQCMDRCMKKERNCYEKHRKA